MKKVLIINTGGTISMEKSDTNLKLKGKENILELCPALKDYNYDYIVIDPLIDSSNASPKEWVKISKLIRSSYERYEGFVVLHGTDTMAYTASALSFILKNLSKPVIFTGSQVPLSYNRSDAFQNLITSVEIASSNSYNIPEVCIFFRDYLYRGNRSRKLDAKNYFGFSSPNFSHLGIAGREIIIDKDIILEKPSGNFYINTNLNENVMIIKLFPGLNPSLLQELFLNNSSNVKGIVLQTFGNGNAPQTPFFMNILRKIIEKGITILNISQCIYGGVKQGLYETSMSLKSIGVVSGYDMTPEAAITKLMWVLGNYDNKVQINEKINENLCGEVSL